MATFEVPAPAHRLWTTRHQPVLEIEDGDVLTFDAEECSGGQFTDFRNGDPVPELDLDRLYPLVGPVLVRGAEPGDVLELELLDYEPETWGWTSVIPGMGLLPDDFPEAHLHRWDLRDGRADFLGAASVPVRPFLGVLGVTPDTDEPRSVIPPGHFGGNLDCRDLTAGARVLLPVQVSGARLMVGDPHAAQGDGEVCVAAIEAGLRGAIRVHLRKGRTIPAPQFITPGPLRQGIEDRGYYGTMGVAPDLMTAARDAVRAMIEHLCAATGLAPLDAYVLASVVVDLKISEVVDAPNWVVSAYLPLSVLTP